MLSIDLSTNRVKSRIRVRTSVGPPIELSTTMVSQMMPMQVVDLCSRQGPDQLTVCTALTAVCYSEADLVISQYPKILSSDLLKHHLLLPLVQGTTTRCRIRHSDQALPTMTIQRSRTIVLQLETDTPRTDREPKETERKVTPGQEQPRTDEVLRMTAISGPAPANREIKAMTITSVRI